MSALVRSVLLLLFLTLSLLGCGGTHKLISARHTSCSIGKLEIRDLVSRPEREDWIAVCGERHFACHTRERNHRLVYGCHLVQTANDAGASDAGASDAGASDAGVPPTSAQDASLAGDAARDALSASPQAVAP
jgi:hypothetical protein